jgi:hypothetical protein
LIINKSRFKLKLSKYQIKNNQMTQKDFIEINGRRYNARSGELVNNTQQVESTKVQQSVSKRNHKIAPHAKPHATNSSVLLMRKAVKKPLSNHSTIKIHGVLSKQPLSPISPRRHIERRQLNATNIAKSQHISHFVRPTATAYPVNTRKPFAANTSHEISVRHISVVRPSRSTYQSTNDMLEAALKAANGHEAMQLPKSSIKKRSGLFSRLGAA